MIADRRAFGPCTTRKGWELRRRVTPVDAALGPTEAALNRLAAAEPLSPDESDAPFRSDGNIVPKPAGVEVCALFEVVFGTVVVIFGSVVLTGSVVVTFGTVVVIFGSVVLTGSVVVTVGTVVVIFGSVVLTGRVVVIVGSAVVMVRAGDADRPATAVLPT